MGTKALVQLVAVLLICALIFGVVKCSSNNSGVTKADAESGSQKVFEDFQINSVSEIKIIDKENSVTVRKGEKHWEVVERDGYKANTKQVVDLLRTVWDTKLAQPVALQENQYGRVRLGDPRKPETAEGEAATLVMFTDGEKDLGTLWLGKPYETAGGRDPMTGGPSLSETGRYIKRNDNELVYVISEPFQAVTTRPAKWLDETFFEVSKVKSVERKTAKPEEDWKLTREKLADEFTLVDAKEGEELDNSKLGNMKTAFSSPQFSDVLVGDEAVVPEGNQFIITTFDDLKYEIALGEKDDNNEFAMSLKVSGEFAEARTPVEGESEEDKKKADEAFSKSLAEKKALLAKAKAYENRVYRLKGFAVNPLNKTRSELYKEEESESPAPPTGMPQGLPPGFGGSGPK